MNMGPQGCNVSNPFLRVGTRCCANHFLTRSCAPIFHFPSEDTRLPCPFSCSSLDSPSQTTLPNGAGPTTSIPASVSRLTNSRGKRAVRKRHPRSNSWWCPECAPLNRAVCLSVFCDLLHALSIPLVLMLTGATSSHHAVCQQYRHSWWAWRFLPPPHR
jgi:hypothetical protein